MGPITVFDKSALEMLSIDESCWLDAFFSCNMTPLFYTESLADLEKEAKKGKSSRSPEDIVSEIANKTPSTSMFPNVFHHILIIQDLLGNKTDMSNRPIIRGGQTKMAPDGKIGIHFDQFPETEALNRWQKREFYETEAIVAKNWRNALQNLDFDYYIAWVKNIVPENTKFKDLKEIKSFLDSFVKNNDKAVFELAFYILGINSMERQIILRRQSIVDKTFEDFAPYASFCLKIDLFFYLALHFGLISRDRPSNRVDIAYLYYLPFCKIFISNDKLHKNAAPLFMEMGQTFVDGGELKVTLNKLDNYYSKLPEKIKMQGIMSFAQYPPVDLENLVTELWDKHASPKWREMKKENENKVRDKQLDKETLKKLKSEQEDSVSIPNNISSDKADSVFIEHMVYPIKGKWHILSQKIIDNHKKSYPTDSVKDEKPKK